MSVSMTAAFSSAARRHCEARDDALPPRRMPVGAEIFPEGVHLRVWAPDRRRAQVVIESGAPREIALTRDDAGYFVGWIPGGTGTRYRFRMDGEATLLPDPASRF